MPSWPVLPIRAGLVCAFAAIFAMGAQSAVDRSFTESFENTTYKDPVATTADWSTAAGEIRLFPFQPSLLATVNTPGTATGVFVDGDYGFVADFTGGLQIYDVSSPSAPVLLSTFASTVQAVVASGDFAYLAAGSGGLKIVGIANPSAPTLVGSVATSGATGIAVAGGHAYVADGSSGLRVISIINPSAPSIVATFDTAGSATDVEVDGDFVYLADGGGGFLILDVTTPSAPSLLATVDTPGNCFGLDVRGNRAYITDSVEGLQIYDLTSRGFPTLIGSIAIATPNDVFASGDRAYIAGNTAGIRIIDISNEASPQLIHTFDTTDADDVVIEDEVAYMADGSAGLRTIRVSQHTGEPRQVATISSVFSTEDIAISGTLAYIADRTAGLKIVDLSVVDGPVVVGTYNTPNQASSVAVAGKYAYVGDSGNILGFDVSDPTNPTLSSSNFAGPYVWDLFIAGDRLYGAIDGSGLQIYDISNPTNPTLLGSYNTSAAAIGVAVAGNRAFLAVTSEGLLIVNISNPASPTLSATLNTPGQAHKVVVAGNIAYVADQGALLSVDVTNLAAPILLGSLPGISSEADALVLDGNRVFLGQFSSLGVVDVSEPSSPFFESSYNRSGSYGLERWGSYVLTGQTFEVLMTSQDRFDTTRPRGQSLTLSAPIPVVRARLSSVQTGSVGWELTADGGTTWQEAQPGGPAIRLPSVGSDLRWRSTHEDGFPPVSPTASSVTIDWFHQSAEIDGMADVPDDQGGFLRLAFGRSGFDFVEETASPATGYQVYGRVEDEGLLRAVASAPIPGDPPTSRFPGLAQFDPERLRILDDRFFVVGDPLDVGDFPPGTWEALSWVAALQRDQYLARVATRGDSTGGGIPWSTYCITTHTTVPSIWYASAPDSGYSIDNIAPQIPENLILPAPGLLSWDLSPDDDFAYFSVYGSTHGAFDETAVLIGHTVPPEFDVSGDPHAYYHVTATDDADNESGAASIMNPTMDAALPIDRPNRYALHPLRPNPAPGSVEVAFSMPEAGMATLEVLDVGGRLVRALSSGFYPAGTHRATWDGNDGQGLPAAAGLYFVRMQAGDFAASAKFLRIRGSQGPGSPR